MNTEKIKQLIENSKLSKHQIAEKTGVNHSVIYRLCSGETKEIKITTAFKLADVLGVDVNEFRR